MRMKGLKKCFGIVFLLNLTLAAYSQVGSCQKIKSAQSTYSLYYCPENLRSDTIDILKYTINLDITDFTTDTIRGNTIVKFKPKVNGQNKLRLDLLKMKIDSIELNSSNLTYTYNDTLLKVNLPLSYNNTDTVEVTVHYHGKPQGDPSGWGGFYFSGNYAFNLGVGFGAKPHNYGRVWFPCFDNFVEKSLYDFNITTSTTKSAYCNGQLVNDVTAGAKRTRSWVLQKEIPSYLASVAVADYTQVNWSTPVMTGTVPIILAARAPDTTALKNAFQNLKTAIAGYENYYGPYAWNRVGYCLVPFSSGAMEHATNIAYPQAAIGGLTYEAELMAHELSHHWWGDLMTCETAEDMWLNEGMATYSQLLFLEWKYGKTAYNNALLPMEDDMVHFAHIREGNQYRAVSGVPHQYTYGDHVYKKGASVAHTLRTYMGDTAFFTGLKYVLTQKAYQNMNSAEFKSLLETSSGKSLADFFNNYVFNGGWPHFSIDSVKYVPQGGGSYLSTVYVKQKLTGTTVLYNNVPLEITFLNSTWQPTVKKINMSGANQSFTMTLPFNPLLAAINYENKISDAISAESKTIKATGNMTFGMGKSILTVVNKGSDSSLIRIEHNYTAPDPIKNNIKNYKISNQRYWKVDGILCPGFHSKIRFDFNGNNGTSGTYTALDTCLTSIQNDSIIILYRKNAADDWKEVDKYTKQKLGLKQGFFICDTLRFGEYAFANKQGGGSVGISEISTSAGVLKVFPNPASSQVNLKLDNTILNGSEYVEIKNIEGKVIYTARLNAKELVVDCTAFAKGTYIVSVFRDKKVLDATKLILQ
jgi:aminopeptidase N